MSSFKKRITVLNKEKEEIESVINKEKVIIALAFPSLPPGQIPLRIFASVLGGFQNLSDSIANTLYNQPSEKGKIPQEILEQNEFILTETMPGSFKAVLELRHPDRKALKNQCNYKLLLSFLAFWSLQTL